MVCARSRGAVLQGHVGVNLGRTCRGGAACLRPPGPRGSLSENKEVEAPRRYPPLDTSYPARRHENRLLRQFLRRFEDAGPRDLRRAGPAAERGERALGSAVGDGLRTRGTLGVRGCGLLGHPRTAIVSKAIGTNQARTQYGRRQRTTVATLDQMRFAQWRPPQFFHFSRSTV